MAEAAQSSPIADRTVRRMGSTPSLSNGRRNFNPEKLLPKDIPQFVQKAVRQSTESGTNSGSTDSSPHEVLVEQLKEAHLSEDESPPAEKEAFDLQPPILVSQTNAAAISKKLLSPEHLQLILLDRNFYARFSAFVQKYTPEYAPILSRYQATQKAKAAVEYANAVAQGLSYFNHESVLDLAPAAALDDGFQSRATTAESLLIENALPAYITHRLVSMVTECLVKEITGRNIPLMQDMVQNIAEVYCLTDPSLPDNPIIYASEEFYHTTQYGMDYVIGRNCRFLNGPETLPASRQKVSQAIRDGKEVCEVILNYRRDGSPFLNLLMISPLYDNKGRIRYFIGCQIDITNLIDQGRGLDSFQRLLAKEHADRRFGDVVRKRSSLALGDLGHMLDAEEIDLLKSTMYEDASESSSPSPRPRLNTARRHLGLDHHDEKNLWPLKHLGPSLPGVYQNYLLVRPYPSLRITFTSPSLRIPGLVQSKLMTRIGGSEHIREGILDAFREGVEVTAKVTWFSQSSTADDESGTVGKPRWIHCTPLLGGDYRVGVWMIVLVEQEEITGSLNVHQQQNRPIKPRVLYASQKHDAYPSLKDRYGPARMYANYMRDMKPLPDDPPRRKDSQRSRTEPNGSIDSATLGMGI